MVNRYRRLIYFFFRWIDEKPRPGITKTLYMADIQMLPGMYIGTIVFTAVLATILAFVGSFFILTYIFPSSLTGYLVLATTGITLAASLVAFPIITSGKISSKKQRIDFALPFLLAYMATLASAGMNPVDTIKHVALKDFGALSTEFRKIVYRFEVLGEDVVTALNYIATNTPSPTFHDILIGISNIVVSGGSLKAYCEQESKNLFDDKKIHLRQFIDSLASYSEGYVGGVTITVILGVIMIIIVGALGIKIVPFLTTQDLMDIFVFFVVPFVNVFFLGMLVLKYSGEE